MVAGRFGVVLEIFKHYAGVLLYGVHLLPHQSHVIVRHVLVEEVGDNVILPGGEVKIVDLGSNCGKQAAEKERSHGGAVG